jgi:urease accessory protein
MDADALVGLLQIADGTFPAGAYAHSFGLETLVQDGEVPGRRGVLAFLRVLLERGAGTSDAVAVAAAVRAAAAADLEAAFGDRRAAGRDEAGGRAARGEPADGPPDAARRRAAPSRRAISRLFAAVERRETPGHHALAFGFAAAAVGASPPDAAAAFLYSTAAAVTGAALRLLPMGQLESQRALAALRPTIGRLAPAAAEASLDDVCCFVPAHEIAAMRHARLDARLFRS